MRIQLLRLIATLAIVVVAIEVRPSAAVTFTPLGDLPGEAVESAAAAISGDGRVVVGTSASANGIEAFRWTAETGMIGLGNVPEAPEGRFESSVTGVSVDGAVIVGESLTNEHSDDRFHAGFRWTDEDGMMTLDDPQFGVLHNPVSVSADGTTIVGNISVDRDPAVFHWRKGEPTVIVQHPVFAGGLDIFEAGAATSDGSVIYGNFGVFNGCCDIFRWDESNGFSEIQPPESAFGTSVRDVFSDGFIATVRGGGGTFWNLGFRWTEGVGFERLSDLDLSAGRAGESAVGVSADGRVIVGSTAITTCPEGNPDLDLVHPGIWDETHGWRDLEQFLIDFGVDLDGWRLGGLFLGPRDISDDGNIVVGTGVNPDGNTEAWLVDLSNPTLLPGDYNADLVVDQADLDFVLLLWGADAEDRPEAWIRNLPEGRIDQAELDDVLLNWGSTQPVAATTAAVPEPATAILLLVTLVAAGQVAAGHR